MQPIEIATLIKGKGSHCRSPIQSCMPLATCGRIDSAASYQLLRSDIGLNGTGCGIEYNVPTPLSYNPFLRIAEQAALRGRIVRGPEWAAPQKTPV